MFTNLMVDAKKPATLYLSFSVPDRPPFQWFVHFKDELIADDFLRAFEENIEKRKDDVVKKKRRITVG